MECDEFSDNIGSIGCPLKSKTKDVQRINGNREEKNWQSKQDIVLSARNLGITPILVQLIRRMLQYLMMYR